MLTNHYPDRGRGLTPWAARKAPENKTDPSTIRRQQHSSVPVLTHALWRDFDTTSGVSILVTRLDDLAEFTDGRAAAIGRACLPDHSVLYRRVCDIRIRTAG